VHIYLFVLIKITGLTAVYDVLVFTIE